MKKLTPLFFLLAAFFILALLVGLEAAKPRPIAPVSGVVHTVDIGPDGPSPATSIIRRGEAVHFNATDHQPHEFHQKVADASANISDPTAHLTALLEGDNWRFKQAGSYEFYDRFNPSITIKVTVYDPAT